MKQDTENNLSNFLRDVTSTNSPASRLNALYELLRLEPVLLTKETQNNLINSLRAAKEAKSNAGLTDAQKRWKKKKEKVEANIDKRWCFFPKSPRMSMCKECNQRYMIDEPCVLDKLDSRGYHPGCAPNEAKEELSSANIYYQRFLTGETE